MKRLSKRYSRPPLNKLQSHKRQCSLKALEQRAAFETAMLPCSKLTPSQQWLLVDFDKVIEELSRL